ncbi:MAG TPA: type VI secretion system baseplate subunit TssK, partial [Pseudomonadales bacterium]|nr:type VI secretion system baseplate subunit TssK [Pseudomonadales bacterium]
MSWSNKIIWSEGLFLQPQHFQQHDRYIEKQLQGRTAPLQGYAWGFCALELNSAALALGKIQLNSGQGIFPDGTPFDFPQQDEPPLPLDVPADLKDELVYLTVPVLRPGTDEADDGAASSNQLVRFGAAEVDVRDSNVSGSGSSALVQIGRLKLRLLRAKDLTDGYVVLGVVKVLERRPDNQVLLQKAYIPPVLHAPVDATLATYLSELRGLLHQRGEALASQLSQPGRGGVSEIADFIMLQTVNRYEPLLHHFASLSVLHPERLYSTCLSLAGELATLAQTSHRPIAYPVYQHDALEACFNPLMADLRNSLSMVIDRNAIQIDLQVKQYGVRVAIVPDKELFKSAVFVLAVAAQLPTETVRARFPAQVKIGPIERISDLVNLQLPGIPLHSMPVAPRQIPFHAGFHYFELEAGGDLWKQLDRSG